MPPSWIVIRCLTGRGLVQWQVGGGALPVIITFYSLHFTVWWPLNSITLERRDVFLCSV